MTRPRRGPSALVAMPALLGGETVTGAAGLARVLLEGDRFPACLAQAFLNYALPDSTLLASDSCVVKDLLNGYKSGGDPAFSGLVRQIALSKSLTVRYPSP